MVDTQENRYITRGVSEQAPKGIQQRCFQLIDEKVKQAEQDEARDRRLRLRDASNDLGQRLSIGEGRV